MTGLILLAAGESKRFGSPKQLLLYKGKTLLQQAIDTALSSGCEPILVVIGANEPTIHASTNFNGTSVIENEGWKEGMASSVRIGISALQSKPDINQAIIMLCDQPFVNSALLKSLIDRKKATQKKIITCFYNETLGPPALFDQTVFNELLQLRGNEGAKKILFHNKENIDTVSFPMGAMDIDTPQDYNNL